MRSLVYYYYTTPYCSTGFPTLLTVYSFSFLCVPAAGNLEVCAEVGGVRQSAAESLEGAVGSDCPATVAAAALHSPWKHGMRRRVQLNQI